MNKLIFFPQVAEQTIYFPQFAEQFFFSQKTIAPPPPPQESNGRPLKQGQSKHIYGSQYISDMLGYKPFTHGYDNSHPIT